MRKGFKIVYSFIFLIICALPLCLMPFVKNNAKIEKRELNKLPSFVSDGRLNIDFSSQFEAWFNDRIPFRSQLLSTANIIKGEALHTPTSNVIVGKDGWLFYESEGDDYMNTNALTDNQVSAIAVTLSLIEENITNKGGRFLFVPMPNKASVYGEYMPSSYEKADENNLTRVMDKVNELGVNYVDMKAVMTANKDKDVYHRRDSHWNYQGALIGYNAIMDGLGKEHKTYENAGYTKRKDWRGDLDKLLYPVGGFMDYQYYYDIDYDNFAFMTPARVTDNKAQLEIFMSDKELGDELIVTANRQTGDDSSLYMVRDSFGRALLPFMIDNYANATFKRTDCPDVNSISGNCDLVYEIVERNLGRIIGTAPFMYAPLRENSFGEGEDTDENALAICDVLGYGIRIYGGIYDGAEIENGRVYVRLENESDTYTFEAFPIYEKELIEKRGEKLPDDITGNVGFSAILSNDYGLSGKYDLYIICGGKSYKAGSVDIK